MMYMCLCCVCRIRIQATAKHHTLKPDSKPGSHLLQV